MYLRLSFDDDVKMSVIIQDKYIPWKKFISHLLTVLILISNDWYLFIFICKVSYYSAKILARYRYLHKKAHLSCLLGSSKRRLILRAFDSNETNVFTLYIKQTVRFSCSIVTEQGNEWLY